MAVNLKKKNYLFQIGAHKIKYINSYDIYLKHNILFYLNAHKVQVYNYLIISQNKILYVLM
jgi:hypothetical protein